MPPADVVRALQKLQAASNKVTLHNAALSKTIGDLLEFLSLDGDDADLPEYTERLTKALAVCADTLGEFCRITEVLSGGDSK